MTHAELIRIHDLHAEEARLNHLEETHPCAIEFCGERVETHATMCALCAEDFPTPPSADLPPEVGVVAGLGPSGPSAVMDAYASLCRQLNAEG